MKYKSVVFGYKSNPHKGDTDGDGLFDGQRVIYDVINSKPVLENEISRKSDIKNETKYRIMIPIDDKPTVKSDYEYVWKEQMQSMKNGNIATNYSKNKGSKNEVMNEMASDADSWVNTLLKKDFLVNKNFINLIEMMFKNSAQGDTAEEWGSDFLDFIYDDKNIAYHSQVNTWQRAFGYNALYDKVFEYGSDMLVNRITFSYNDKEYILWSWKGDYWNLQSGGETGLYVYDRTVNGYDHYDAVNFELPMTLSLYKGSGKKTEAIFNWAPIEEQWWITGFNPKYKNPDPDVMVSVASIDLSEHVDFYNAISDPKNSEYYNEISAENLIFDDASKTVWIQWYT